MTPVMHVAGIKVASLPIMHLWCTRMLLPIRSSRDTGRVGTSRWEWTPFLGFSGLCDSLRKIESPSAIERFIINRVSGHISPVSCFTAVSRWIAANRRKAFWAAWSLWTQYIKWPLEPSCHSIIYTMCVFVCTAFICVYLFVCACLCICMYVNICICIHWIYTYTYLSRKLDGKPLEKIW